LNGADCIFKRQTLGPENMRRRALAVTNDGSEYDCPVDLTPLSAFCRGGRGLQNAQQGGRDSRFSIAAGRAGVFQATEIA
jgi:hypothetical protein